MACVAGNIHGAGRLLVAFKKLCQRILVETVLPRDNRGNTLTDRGQHCRLIKYALIVMTVRIHEPGGQHEARSVDHRIAVDWLDIPDRCNVLTNYAHAQPACRIAGTVNNPGVDDNGACRRWWFG